MKVHYRTDTTNVQIILTRVIHVMISVSGKNMNGSVGDTNVDKNSSYFF